MEYTFGKNHKGEKILKLYLKQCPICNTPMSYYEFMFDMSMQMENEMDRILRIQAIEELKKKTINGEPVKILSMLLGCPYCYGMKKKKQVDKLDRKPYMVLDAETVFHLNQTPISHVYLTEKI